ncbi:MAG: hypothetical protein QXM08_03595 [Thermofilaceae archaeon]
MKRSKAKKCKQQARSYLTGGKDVSQVQDQSRRLVFRDPWLLEIYYGKLSNGFEVEAVHYLAFSAGTSHEVVRLSCGVLEYYTVWKTKHETWRANHVRTEVTAEEAKLLEDMAAGIRDYHGFSRLVAKAKEIAWSRKRRTERRKKQ